MLISVSDWYNLGVKKKKLKKLIHCLTRVLKGIL